MTETSVPVPLPNHLAIIMDGNGRWARARNKERFWGHVKGARVAKTVIEHCANRQLPHLTLYTFSEENWARPSGEIRFLMRLLLRYVHGEKQRIHENNIRVRCVGQLNKLPPIVLSELEDVMELTKDNTGMVLTFALSYGGRQEITHAARELARKAQAGLLNPENIDESTFASALQNYPNPDPDLLIRTSGEWRLSNFLTWQSVYTELFFSQSLWPEFTVEELEQTFADFSKRERRYGGLLKKNPNETLQSLNL